MLWGWWGFWGVGLVDLVVWLCGEDCCFLGWVFEFDVVMIGEVYVVVGWFVFYYFKVGGIELFDIVFDDLYGL